MRMLIEIDAGNFNTEFAEQSVRQGIYMNAHEGSRMTSDEFHETVRVNTPKVAAIKALIDEIREDFTAAELEDIIGKLV